LENRLGEIDPECCNSHCGRLLPFVGVKQLQYGTLRCRWVEPSTPSDECEPVSVCQSWRPFMPRQADATRRERRVELAFLVEVVKDRGVDGREFPKTSHPSEAQRRPFPSSKRQVGILGPIVQPAVWCNVSPPPEPICNITARPTISELVLK
jgi:hypothetical protein